MTLPVRPSPKRTRSPHARLVWLTVVALAVLLAAYVFVWQIAHLTSAQMATLWPFTGLGTAGALIANSTGVGGGAVFVPAFSLLRETGGFALSHNDVVGLSFAIQCFGMSVGSLTWLNRMARDRQKSSEPGLLPPVMFEILGLTLVFSLPAMLITQWTLPIEPSFGFLAFKIFSITLGILLIGQTLFIEKPETSPQHLSQLDRAGLIITAISGGMATAWFSVGIGELLALYLFLRHYDMLVCAASAVFCTAISVLVGVIYHLVQGQVMFEVLVFAAPGVMLGGFLARRLAYWLGPLRLKLFAAIWIVLSSLALL